MEFVETDSKSISAPNGQQLYKTMAYSYEYVMVLHGVGSRISFRRINLGFIYLSLLYGLYSIQNFSPNFANTCEPKR